MPPPNANDDKQIKAIARSIATELGERDKKPFNQIHGIVRYAGEDFARELVAEAKKIQETGGMLTSKGDRQRTLGGVFFAIARDRLPEEIRLRVFFTWLHKSRERAMYEAQFEPFEWDNRADIVEKLSADAGEITDMKITLTGRPGSIERRENLIITSLAHNVPENITVPLGVPDAEHLRMSYTIYISARQWERVEKQLEKNERDQLLIEGFAGFDPDTKAMVVYAIKTTTNRLMKQERQKQRQLEQKAEQQQEGATRKKPARAAKSDEPRSKPERKLNLPPVDGQAVSQTESGTSVPFAPARLQDGSAERTAPKIDVPPGLSAEDAKRYTDLSTAAETYRQRIRDIESKPAGQQFGLEMTQKLLSNIEKQIKDIAQKQS